MFSMPKLSKGSIFPKCNRPIHGSRDDKEIVAPLDIMKKAFKEAFEEHIKEQSNITIILDGERIAQKTVTINDITSKDIERNKGD